MRTWRTSAQPRGRVSGKGDGNAALAREALQTAYTGSRSAVQLHPLLTSTTASLELSYPQSLSVSS